MGRPKNKILNPKLIYNHDAPYIAWNKDRKTYRLPLQEFSEDTYEAKVSDIKIALLTGKWPKWAEKMRGVSRWLADKNVKIKTDDDQAIIDSWAQEFIVNSSQNMLDNRLYHLNRLSEYHDLRSLSASKAADFMKILTTNGIPKYFSHYVAAMMGDRVMRREKILAELTSKEIFPPKGKANLKQSLTSALRNREVFLFFPDKDKKTIGSYQANKQRQGVTPSTRNDYLHTFKMFYRWMKKHEICINNPFEDIKQIKIPHKDGIVHLSRKERDKIIKTVKGQDYEVAVWIAIYAGLRRSELARLRKNDIDLENRWITVKAGKTGKMRMVPISPALKKKLAATSLEHRIIHHWPANSYSNTAESDLDKLVRLLPKELEPKIRWNVFRHTFASLLAQTGQMSIDQIAALMGNSPEVCRRHYAHLLPESADQTGINLID